MSMYISVRLFYYISDNFSSEQLQNTIKRIYELKLLLYYVTIILRVDYIDTFIIWISYNLIFICNHIIPELQSSQNQSIAWQKLFLSSPSEVVYTSTPYLFSTTGVYVHSHLGVSSHFECKWRHGDYWSGSPLAILQRPAL